MKIKWIILSCVLMICLVGCSDDLAQKENISENKSEIFEEFDLSEEINDEKNDNENTPYFTDSGYLVFGMYEQDGDESNGPEPIEWEVLGSDENGMLIISRYIMITHPYNDEYVNVTWEDCSLRKWLNDDFYNSAFSDTEKNCINSVELENQDNPRPYIGDSGKDGLGGNNTVDCVFILDMSQLIQLYEFQTLNAQPLDAMNEETWDYYGYSENLLIERTKVASNGYKGEITEDKYNEILLSQGYSSECIGMVVGQCWIRTPGRTSKEACYISYYGQIGAAVYSSVNDDGMGVRPAMYIVFE